MVASQDTGYLRQDTEAMRTGRPKETIEPRDLTFRQRAHDRAALPRWMQDIMYAAHGDEEQSAANAKKSTAAFIVAQRKRHAIVYNELRRQTAVHSPHLADLYGKLWEGEDAIVAHLVRQSEYVQATANSWEEERMQMKKDANDRVQRMSRKYEDAKLDLAVCKATLRDRDSDLETMEMNIDNYRVGTGGFTITSTCDVSDGMRQGKGPLFENSTRDDLSSQTMSRNGVRT